MHLAKHCMQHHCRLTAAADTNMDLLLVFLLAATLDHHRVDPLPVRSASLHPSSVASFLCCILLLGNPTG